VNESFANGALLRTVLTESLTLWGISARVERGAAPAVAEIRATDGTIIWIELAGEGMPFRWTVRWRPGNEAPGGAREKRRRHCPSLVGVLNAMRGALGVERGAALRVAPAPRTGGLERLEGKVPAPNSTANEDPAIGNARIPVSILTGFLGSGKTTLLARLLHHPAMARTAVVINEFGAIGLDHELIETSDETLVTLSTGCLCCKVRSDLALTLADLAARRAAGEVLHFERVVIETSGLADPAPILHALTIDSALHELYAIAEVITTVDALTGVSTLARYPESLKQAALADRIVLTKTDVEGAQIEETVACLREINPRAPVLRVVRGDIAPSALFDRPSRAASGAYLSTTPAVPGRRPVASDAHHHSSGISSFTLVRGSMHAATLALFLSVLAENCGSDLLRLKGIVALAEEPDRPAVIHGVQHVYHAPEWLERWPSEDRTTRMVFIGRNIHEAWVRAVLELLEIEVKDALRARARKSA
jgi:G3E family GTPase